MGLCWDRLDGAVMLRVRLTPRARKAGLGDVVTLDDGETWLAVTVSAPPEKGKANEALEKLLAKNLKHPRSAIGIAHGATSRRKRIRIEGDPQEIEERLATLIEGRAPT
ncbi:MAG: DUF167 family protein [Geminicoccaceae bacterium]